MPSFADSIFLFILALLLFGPKKLPVLARELGKWMGEFRRASNEFKMQMEDELRLSEQAERQKQIAAMEAAAPLPPPLDEPEHPHLPRSEAAPEPKIAPPVPFEHDPHLTATASDLPALSSESTPLAGFPVADAPETIDGVRPIPIATSGDLRMMPPATGLPASRGRNGDPLSGLLDSIPETSATEPAFAQSGNHTAPHTAPETTAHAD